MVILEVCSTGSYGSPSHCKRWTRPVLPWDTKRWHSVCSCLQSLRAAAEWTGLHVKLWCYCRSHLKMTNWSLMLQEWILNFWNYQWELFNATYLFLRFHSTIGNYHSCKDYILQLSNQLNVITFYIIMSIGFSILLKNTISVIKSINELKCQCFNYSSFICFYLRVQKMTLPWHVTNDGISWVILKATGHISALIISQCFMVSTETGDIIKRSILTLFLQFMYRRFSPPQKYD